MTFLSPHILASAVRPGASAEQFAKVSQGFESQKERLKALSEKVKLMNATLTAWKASQAPAIKAATPIPVVTAPKEEDKKEEPIRANSPAPSPFVEPSVDQDVQIDNANVDQPSQEPVKTDEPQRKGLSRTAQVVIGLAGFAAVATAAVVAYRHFNPATEDSMNSDSCPDTLFSRLSEQASNLTGQASELISGAAEQMKDSFATRSGQVSEFVSSAAEQMKDSFTTRSGQVSDFISDAAGQLKEAVVSRFTNNTGHSDMTGLGSHVPNQTPVDLGNSGKNVTQHVLDQVVDQITDVVQTGAAEVVKQVEPFVNPFNPQVDGFTPWDVSTSSAVANPLPTSPIVTQISDAVHTGAAEVAKQLEPFVNPFKPQVDGFTPWTNSLPTSPIVNSPVGPLSTSTDLVISAPTQQTTVMDVLTGVYQKGSDGIGFLNDLFQSTKNSFLNKLGEVAQHGMGVVRDIARNVAEKSQTGELATGTLELPAPDAGPVFTGMGSNQSPISVFSARSPIQEAGVLDNLQYAVSEQLSSAKDVVSETFSGALNGVKNYGSNLISEIAKKAQADALEFSAPVSLPDNMSPLTGSVPMPQVLAPIVRQSLNTSSTVGLEQCPADSMEKFESTVKTVLGTFGILIAIKERENLLYGVNKVKKGVKTVLYWAAKTVTCPCWCSARVCCWSAKKTRNGALWAGRSAKEAIGRRIAATAGGISNRVLTPLGTGLVATRDAAVSFGGIVANVASKTKDLLTLTERERARKLAHEAQLNKVRRNLRRVNQ